MRRQELRVRIDDSGQVEIIDPGFDVVPFLREIDPAYDIRSTPLPGFTEPRLTRTAREGVGISHSALRDVDGTLLGRVHREALAWRREEANVGPAQRNEASLLDVKIELARRALSACELCAHRCRVDRTREELGVCRLGIEATVAEHFVHIAEESFVNPSLILSLVGCGLRCQFCQQSALLDPSKVLGELLDGDFWPVLDPLGARSLSFVGGNPDESLYAILKFLNSAPADWNLPTVWNSHGYATEETLELLDGVVDAYIPDLKYSNDSCGRLLSRVPNYPATARAAIAAMAAQCVPTIVRILVLPGHFECCHVPALEFLASVNRANLFVSVRGQYCPDWKITEKDGALARRTTLPETAAVRSLATQLSLNVVDSI